MNAAETLAAAAEIIERDGWWDGSPGPDDGACCALTAIAKAARETMSAAYWWGYDEASATFRAFLEGHGGGHSIAAWNDAQPHGEAVVSALRACAQQLAGEAA